MHVGQLCFVLTKSKSFDTTLSSGSYANEIGRQEKLTLKIQSKYLLLFKN